MSEQSTYGFRALGPAEEDTFQLRVRVQLLLTVLLIVTNVVGALIVVALGFIIIPGERPNQDFGLALAIATPVYVALAVVLGAPTGR